MERKKDRNKKDEGLAKSRREGKHRKEGRSKAYSGMGEEKKEGEGSTGEEEEGQWKRRKREGRWSPLRNLMIGNHVI